MDGGKAKKFVITSALFEASLIHIIDEGIERFGYYQANRYLDFIEDAILHLDSMYSIYPECRHLATQSRMYRNILLASHLIIYRITDERIEVLNIVHAASSMNKIRKARSIKIE